MASRSKVGYLVGYQASNIFKVWFPQERKVVESRDVDFDENSKYDPNAPLPEDKLMETTPLQQHTVEIPMYEGDFTQSQPLEEEGELEEDEEGEDPREDVQKFSEAHQLPTPETTPGPSNEPLYTEQPERPVHQLQHHPSREIRGDIDKSNIVKGSRTRKPRREAYMVQLNKPPDSLFDSLHSFNARK